MTVAAVALALALLVVPASSRRRALALMTVPQRRRRTAVMPLAVTGCAALSLLMPWTAILGLGLLVATLLVRRRVGIRRQAGIEEAS